MKKNEIFTFTAPNGVEVTAVVIESIFQGSCRNTLICYAQNRIFTCIEETYRKNEETGEWLKDYSYGKVIVDYAILPDYDAALEDFYQHEKNVKVVQGFGYTKAEASNILEGKNTDGSDFEELPF